MSIFYIIPFAFGFSLLAYKNFRWAVGVLILLLPTYLIRFRIGPLPSTLLELAFGIIFILWLIRYASSDMPRIIKFFTDKKFLALSILLFFISSVISIFISDMWWYSFGQWRAYFLEPMILFFILIGRQEKIGSDYLMTMLCLTTFSVALFGIIQKFTGWALPTAEWQNPETRRITSFFTSPNAVGLYLGPLMFLITTKLLGKINDFKKKEILFYASLFTMSAVAIFFTKSVGTLIGLASGISIYLIFSNRKKIAVALILLAVLLTLTPPARQLITAKGRSGENRLQLWNYSAEFLSSSPKNFIFGTGIRQFFRKIQKPHYDKEELERLIYPHNIFLNFWTEIGLFGMIAFTGIYIVLIRSSLRIHRTNVLLGVGFLAMLTALTVHGLIDVPYFKNDLSMMFWVVSALILMNKERPL